MPLRGAGERRLLGSAHVPSVRLGHAGPHPRARRPSVPHAAGMPTTRPRRSGVVDEDCPGLLAPGRTMLGRSQERRLRAGIASDPEALERDRPADADGAVERRPRRSPAHIDGRLGRLPGVAADRLLQFVRDSGARSGVVHQRRQSRQLRQPTSSPTSTTWTASRSRPSSAAPRSVGRTHRRASRERPARQPAHQTRRRHAPGLHRRRRHRPSARIARLRVIDDPADPRTGVETQVTFAIDAGRPGAQAR